MEGTFHVAELAPSRGVGWIKEAFALFRQKPFAWIGLCTGWLLLTLVLLQVPLIGPAIASFLQPVFFASFAIASFRQVAGEPVMMGDLFSGFRRNVRALVQLGAVLLVAELVIVLLMWTLGLPALSASDGTVKLSEYFDSLKGKEWILFVGFALSAMVKGAFWFAPPLIAFHEMSTSQAARWSAYAAISNLGAMVLYGLLLVVGFIAALIPWGLGLLVVVPVMAISTFIGYREVFQAGRAPLSSEAPP